MTKRLILILVALAVIPILILLAGLAVWATGTSSSGGSVGGPIQATPILMPSTPEMSTPVPTAAAIPAKNNPEHLTLPPDAKLATVNEAVEYARVWATEDGSVTPRLIEVRLETLRTALETTDKQIGTDPSGAMSAQNSSEANKPVWRIIFGGSYFIPSCPVPDNPATPDNCGETASVEYVIDPVDGSDYSASYGVSPLPSATP